MSLKSLEDIAIDEANNNFVKILDGVVLGNNGKVFIIENTVEYSDDIRSVSYTHLLTDCLSFLVYRFFTGMGISRLHIRRRRLKCPEEFFRLHRNLLKVCL